MKGINMNATLNIQDYLSEDEIKGILIGEYRTWFRTMSFKVKSRVYMLLQH